MGTFQIVTVAVVVAFFAVFTVLALRADAVVVEQANQHVEAEKKQEKSQTKKRKK